MIARAAPAVKMMKTMATSPGRTQLLKLLSQTQKVMMIKCLYSLIFHYVPIHYVPASPFKFFNFNLCCCTYMIHVQSFITALSSEVYW